MRLNSNGTIDATFHAPLPMPKVSEAISLPDGKLLLNLPGYGIRRLLADGALDETFNPPRPFEFDPVSYNPYPDLQMFVQPDGKIVVKGAFTQVDGIRRPGLARLNADGAVDINFQVPFSSVGAVFGLPDGRFLANNYPGPWQLLTADGAVTTDALLPGVQSLVALDDGRILDTVLHCR